MKKWLGLYDHPHLNTLNFSKEINDDQGHAQSFTFGARMEQLQKDLEILHPNKEIDIRRTCPFAIVFNVCPDERYRHLYWAIGDGQPHRNNALTFGNVKMMSG
jgi:hypothetical protein